MSDHISHLRDIPCYDPAERRLSSVDEFKNELDDILSEQEEQERQNRVNR